MSTFEGGGAGPVSSLTLADAVAAGQVEVDVSGVGPGVTSQVNVQITNLTDGPLTISIPAGTELVPLVDGYQTHPVTQDVTVDVPAGPGQTVTVTVPSLCASPFGYQPAPTDGSVPYQVSSGPSPVMPVLSTVDQLTPQFVPLASSIGMPIDLFTSTVAQYAVWAAFGTPPVDVPATPSTDDTGGGPSTPSNGGDTGGGPAPTGGRTYTADEYIATHPVPEDATIDPDLWDGVPSQPEPTGTTTVVVPPFTATTVEGILGPQLTGQGATPEQVTQIVGIMWGAVDTTLKAVKDADPEGGVIGGLIQGLAGMGAAPATDGPPQTMEKPSDADYIQATTENQPLVDEGGAAEGGRYTVEQMQADRWDDWDGAYNPTGEYAFVSKARVDLANPDYDDDTKRIRMWIIAIYEETYRYYRSQGFTNLVAHAMAHIRVDEWRNESVTQFEQTFGTHFSNLGMAISADPLGAYQRLVAEGVAVEVPKVLARYRLRGVGAIINEGDAPLAAGVGSGARTGTRAVGRMARPSRAYLLANDSKAIAQALKIKPKPGYFDVICHGEADSFSLNISGKWVKVGPKSIADAMRKAGYQGGPVRLIACDTGSTATGAARQLADELGVIVEAPTGKVWATNNGGTFVAKAEFVNGKWVIGKQGTWTKVLPKVPKAARP